MTDERPRNDAAMAEILASIRRIVADEDARATPLSHVDVEGDVLILTREMRILDEDAAAETKSAAASRDGEPPEAALSVDEAAVVEIARIVLRDEFDGAFGQNLTAQITQLVRAEVARALADEGRARE